MISSDGGVLISDGRSSVRLTRMDKPNELGHPTLIEAQAGPFRGSVRDDTVYFGNFRSQLTKLYDTLSGDAKLASYEGFELDLIGNGMGHIRVDVTVIGQHVPLIRLTFGFSIDQTFLPMIIRQVDAEFPPPYRAAA